MVVDLDPDFLEGIGYIQKSAQDLIERWETLTVEQQCEVIDKTMHMLDLFMSQKKGKLT